MPPATSAAFQIELTTVKGATLRLRSMVAQEEISTLFDYQIVALSDDADLLADDLLGTPVSIALPVGGHDAKRWFHGLVTAFGFDGVDGRLFSYRLTVRPALWLLTRSADMRIFQGDSVVEIVKKVLADYKVDIDDTLSATYPKRDYCVQYRETDFNFVSRLLEEEGIFYFFRHSESQHQLVLADASNVHEIFAGFDSIPFFSADHPVAEKPAINQWQVRHEIQPGQVTLSDFNFETPSTALLSASTVASRQHGEAKHEVYDYPGLYTAKAAGDTRAKIRLEEFEGRFGRFVGQGNSPGLVVGTRFTLAKHPRTDQNVEYIVLSTQIEMRQSADESLDDQSAGFSCRFTAQAYSEPLRPARVSPKPSVAGPQTAIVVGDAEADAKAGDIVTDEHGRVKVQFHWARLSKKTDGVGQKKPHSSCWVRVASPSAGNGFGMIALPRIGQEVVVDFLEGDPDQPLITGRVYNAAQKSPYALPANATVSTLKSRSKLGGAADFNELRFEDKAGAEYLLLHAQKDRFEFVEETLKSEIGKDEHRTVKANRKEKVDGEYHLSVAKDVKQKLDAKFSLDAGKDILIKTGGIYSLKAAKDITAQSGAAISFKSTGDLHMKIGANIGAEGGQNVHIKAGMSVVIEAGMQISIKAGGSSIVLGPDGVSITGAMVKINSGGSPGSGSGASPVAPTDPEAPEAPEVPKDPLTHR